MVQITLDTVIHTIIQKEGDLWPVESLRKKSPNMENKCLIKSSNLALNDQINAIKY